MDKAQDDNCDVEEITSYEQLVNVVDLTRITSISLIRCGLSELPDLPNIWQLRRLNLAHNKLTSVPLCLYTGMKTVEHLDLSHNLIGCFLTRPQCGDRLRSLKLGFNQFQQLPDWVLNFSCCSLEELDFSGNPTKDYNFAGFCYNRLICKLRKVRLCNAGLKDSCFRFWTTFERLQHLDVSNEGRKNCNFLVDENVLFTDYKWQNMQVLVLNGLGLSILPESLMFIETLKELYLKKNNLSWLPDSIANLINLEVLDVSDNLLGALKQELNCLTNLRILKAQNNYIREIFSFSPNLRCLDLYNNCLENGLYNIDSLECVDLEKNYFDPSKLEGYSDKLRCLRSLTDELRSTGCKEEIFEDYNSESNFSEDTILSDEIFYIHDNEICEENWDETTPDNQLKPKISDITDSDNEWIGEPLKSFKRTGNLSQSNDFLYEDAVEV